MILPVIASIIFIVMFFLEVAWIRRMEPSARPKIIRQLLPSHIGIVIMAIGVIINRPLYVYAGIVITILMVAIQYLHRLPPHYRAAHRRFLANDMKGAMQFVNKSIQARPDSCEAHYLRSLIYLASGQLTEAEQDAKKAMYLDSACSLGFRAFGQIYYFQGNYLESKEAYIKALKLEPGYASLLCSLGQVCYRLEEYETAVEHLKTAMTLRPTEACNLSIHYYLGCCYEEMEMEDEANREFKTMRRYRRGLAELKKQYSYWPDSYPEMALIREDFEDMEELLE